MILKKDRIINNISARLIELRGSFNNKEILENKNPKKVFNIIKKIPWL